ncbi:DNA-directed RNA polymerase I subunit RPA34.5-domain-containing protein [Biscogniauxia sp. FL1348]|nr:DNA-directed RNA polymerase I subunit RPA34.5-domain-containing protein [Biscogniauxia sp. FL1348]
MAKGKFAAGSLNSIHSNIRNKKTSDAAAAKTPLARSREQLNAKDLSDSSSSSSSSSDSSDGSGSDSDVEAERQKLQAKLASKKKPAGPKPNGTKSTPAKPTPDATKGTSDSDSDSESVSTRASLSKALSADRAAKQKTTAESESESTSDSDSDSESDSESENEGVNQGSKKDAKPSAKADASSSEESDTSETSSSEDEGEDDGSAAKNAASKNKNDKNKGNAGDSADDSRAIARVNGDKAAAESSTEVARPQWLNNSDFMLRKASSDNPGKEVAEFFNNANLEGKQLWYFTAPASLPITVLKDMEIDLAKVTSGGPLLKHEGDDYGLDLEPYATSTQIQLLIPSHGGDKYTALNRGIDSTIHLRRMAKFGPGGEVGATASNEYIPQPKPIRQQPTGLKPRFTPIGVPNPKLPAATGNSQRGAASKVSSESRSKSSSTSDSESDSDVEMANAPEVPLSTPSAANGTLKRKLPTGEQSPPFSAAKGAKSDGKTTKKPKSTATAPTPSRLLDGKKETPVQPPNLSRIITASTATPSNQSTSKSKDKKGKKGSKDKPAKTLEGPETPVPPPSYLGLTR